MEADHDPIVAFLGLGLISGSLAGALKRGSWQADLIAWGPRAPSLERGLALGLIDRFSLDLTAIVAEADVIVIGAPPEATAQLLPEVLNLASSSGEPVVTDMASIKGVIVQAAGTDYPRFVPGHPIAGSENSGVEAAYSGLFDGREVITWHRIKDFQLLSLKLLAEQLILGCPRHGSSKALTSVSIYVPGELSCRSLHFRSAACQKAIIRPRHSPAAL